MKKSSILIASLIIFALYILTFFVTEYQSQQTKLAFESNDLYSSKHVFINSTFEEIMGNKKIKNISDLSIFIPLESNNEEKIKGYYSNNYSKNQFPLRNGRFFLTKNSKEAIVGKNVTTTINNADKYYQFNGVNYRVVGTLGLINPSFLDYTVLINDTSLFSNNKSNLVIDGSTIDPSIYNRKQNYQKNIGIDRKIDSDFFSPIIYSLSGIIIIISTILVAYIQFLELKKEDLIKFILGEATISRYLSSIKYLVCICILSFSLVLVFLVLTNSAISNYSLLFELLLIQFILFLATFSILFCKEERKMLFGTHL
ncbi:hypothetical protein [Enterococcus termitis]|uniref:MacB-like periplasmic core domain-containing protein n=1 Tax=Enterococcus termitis TaxID=332950 RepID=A0A1E5GD10_9ENTE|nr:hypothetical protein [Enterococcus termitis]OEG10616.1 hypothetical protein BCR25_09120 [Enterococcus termitis]OJG97875.1 hypothetical protein RV18_GL003889 [Enterococcus termitis]